MVYVHLNLRSEYNLKDSLIKHEKLAVICKKRSIVAVAITNDNMFGTIDFYKQLVTKGIKPIVGCRLKVKSSYLKETQLIALCKNNNGYKHLCYLSSSKEPLEIKDLQSKDLLYIVPGIQSDLLHACQEDYEEYIAKSYQRLEVCIAIHRLGFKSEDLYISKSIKLAAKNKIPIVTTNNVAFYDRSDFELHNLRVKIANTNETYTEEQYLKSSYEMRLLFQDLSTCIENTLHIAKICNVKISKAKNFIFPQKENNQGSKILRNKAYNGLSLKNIKSTTYLQRLEFELKTIIDLKFSDYFLIIEDLCSWSKKNGVPVGPGRGSVSGSLLAYSLGITKIDPIKYGLLFERFLNKERKTFPDIDIDLCPRKRELVMRYLKDKYGENRVCQITAHNRMNAKAAIKDSARALNLSFSLANEISSLVDSNLSLSKQLQDSESSISKFKSINSDFRDCLQYASKLEGLMRHSSKHAAGVVITSQEATSTVPIYYEEGIAITQYDKGDLEFVGLIKFDLLGLKTLTVIDEVCKLENIKSIPLNDAATMQMINSGDANGVFQLESAGMVKLAQQVQAKNIEEIAMLIALYRPGPIKSGMVKKFLNNKITGDFPKKSIVSETYGVILYQEQILKISNQVAGFTLTQGDLLLKAIGKKQQDLMDRLYKSFVSNPKVSKEQAKKVFKIISAFAEYGFNKAHAIAYATLTYITAYLKLHYCAAFNAELLNTEIHNKAKLTRHLRCLSNNIELLPPSVAVGNRKFIKVNSFSIRYGLDAIKGRGSRQDYILAGAYDSRNLNHRIKILQQSQLLTVSDWCELSLVKKETELLHGISFTKSLTEVYKPLIDRMDLIDYDWGVIQETTPYCVWLEDGSKIEHPRRLKPGTAVIYKRNNLVTLENWLSQKVNFVKLYEPVKWIYSYQDSNSHLEIELNNGSSLRVINSFELFWKLRKVNCAIIPSFPTNNLTP